MQKFRHLTVMQKGFYTLFMCLFAWQAQAAVVIPEGPLESYQLHSEIEGYLSPQKSWSIASKAPAREHFKDYSKLDWRQIRDSIGWIRVELDNPNDTERELTFFSRDTFYPLHAYRESNDGALELVGGVSHLNTGKPLDSASGALSLTVRIKAKERIVYYLQIQRKNPKISIPFYLSDKVYFEKEQRLISYLTGLLAGIAIIMAIYNAFHFIHLRETPFFLYALYAGFYALCFLWGYNVPATVSDDLWIRQHWDMIYVWSTETLVISICVLIDSLLRLRQEDPPFSLIFRSLPVFILANLVIQSLTSMRYQDQIASIYQNGFGLMALWAGVRSYRRGYHPALYFLIGWGIFLGANAYFTLARIGVFPSNFLTDWAVAFGAAAEMLVVSLALSDRVKIEQEQAQEKIYALNEQLNLTNAELEKNLETLKKSEAARTQFFHNTSHELRTPLNGILGYIGLILRGQAGTIPDNTYSILQKVLRLSDSLKMQINTILDLAQAKKGELTVAGSEVHLHSFVEQVTQLAEGLCHHQRHVRFSNELHIDHGEAPTFLTDYDKVFAMTRNLISNAIKFSPTTRDNHVQFHVHRRKNWLIIEVIDEGIGIPEDMLEKVFNEFVQVSGEERRRYEGTGLGLTLVRNFATALEGKIEVTSKLHQGSRFTLKIPELSQTDSLRKAEEKDLSFAEVQSTISRDQQHLPSSAQELKDSFLVVVDDHPENCEILTKMLEYHGATTQAFQDGRQAINAMQMKRPDLLLLDMMMPEFSGEDVLEEMRAHPELKKIPVIVLTARAGESDRLQCFAIGADDYLAKPILEPEIVLRIRNILHRVRLTKEIAALEANLKLTLVGEILRENIQETQILKQTSEGMEEVAQEFPHLIDSLLPKEGAWARLNTSGDFVFDPSLLSTHMIEQAFLSGYSVKDPLLRQLYYFLSGLQISDSDREKLGLEARTWEPTRLRAVAAAFHILSSFLEGEQAYGRLNRLLSSILPLCQESYLGSKPAKVVDLLENIWSNNQNTSDMIIQKELAGIEWPLPEGDVLAFLYQALHIVLRACYKAQVPRPMTLYFQVSAEQPQHLYLSIRPQHAGGFASFVLTKFEQETLERLAQKIQLKLDIKLSSDTLSLSLSLEQESFQDRPALAS